MKRALVQFSLVMISAAILAGCADAPNYKGLNPVQSNPSSSLTRFYFLRSGGWPLTRETILIDGKAVLELRPDSATYCDVAPGVHRLNIEGGESKTLLAQGGDLKYFHLSHETEESLDEITSTAGQDLLKNLNDNNGKYCLVTTTAQ